MLQLAEDVFATKNDPDQLDVNEKVIARLQKIHPATVSEYDDGNAPVVWILLLPTSIDLMNKFISRKISEKELFERTAPNSKYEAIYLCSAIALEEFRGKGIAKRLTLGAINSIRKDHSIKSLFVWPFSKEGNQMAELLSKELSLPLLKRMK